MRTRILRTALARAETELNFSRKETAPNLVGMPEGKVAPRPSRSSSLFTRIPWFWWPIEYGRRSCSILREGTTRQQNCFSISSFHLRPTASTRQGRPRRLILHSLIQQLGMGQWESKPTYWAPRPRNGSTLGEEWRGCSEGHPWTVEQYENLVAENYLLFITRLIFLS